MDGLEFRSLINEISVKETESAEKRSEYIHVTIDHWNPMNQSAYYDPSKVDKDKLKPRGFDILMENFAMENLVPDLLFAVTTEHAEGIFLFDVTKNKDKKQ